jgi:hypothetical protein
MSQRFGVPSLDPMPLKSVMPKISQDQPVAVQQHHGARLDSTIQARVDVKFPVVYGLDIACLERSQSPTKPNRVPDSAVSSKTNFPCQGHA